MILKAVCLKMLGRSGCGTEWEGSARMPDNLLLELETAAPIAGNLENIEDLVRVVIREAGAAVGGMKGLARVFEKTWQRLVVEVAKGRTAEVLAVRPVFLRFFETRLSELKRTHVFVTWLSTLNGTNVPDPGILVPEIENMEQLKACIFDHWNSADDLERLAVEHYPLSQSRLEKIASRHAPPAEWYQREEEQLFQE
jgi:hypothetical protein